MSQKVKGLRLTVGGAPLTPHVVPGLPGFYYPHKATPVGGDGEATLEQAKRAADGFPDGDASAAVRKRAAENAAVELVDMTEKEANDAREALSEVRKAARKGLLERRRDAEGAEAGLVRDHAAALSGQKEG